MNLIEEVKNDMEYILRKERSIEGYHVVKELLEVLPKEFYNDLEIREDILFIGGEKIDSLDNICEIDINNNTDVTYKQYIENRYISISRSRKKDIYIYFHGWDKENKKYSYYEVTTKI